MMGSGDKLRFKWFESNYVSLGIFIGRRCEHEWSINIDLIKFGIYIGFGKGYEEFR
jgi:hypothetical protein